MATQRQIEANRRNARKSTGPRTESGKNRSRWNALQHGLASVHTVLPHEDPAEYHRIRAGLLETWQPANAQELLLVDQVAQGHWRMERARRFENAMFDLQLRTLKRTSGIEQTPDASDDTAIAIALSDPENETGYRTFFRYDSRAQSTYYRALDHLQKIHAQRLRRSPFRRASTEPIRAVETLTPPWAELALFRADAAVVAACVSPEAASDRADGELASFRTEPAVAASPASHPAQPDRLCAEVAFIRSSGPAQPVPTDAERARSTPRPMPAPTDTQPAPTTNRLRFAPPPQNPRPRIE